MRSFCLTQPSPPEAWGEEVGDVAGFSNHKALNRFTFPPSPNGGEGQGEGEVIFSAKSALANLCIVGRRLTSILLCKNQTGQC